MESAAITSQVLHIKKTGSPELRNQLLFDLQGEALKIARIHCKRRIDTSDDEYIVALKAMNEAIDSYDRSKGASFLTFAKTVIEQRLKDHYKSTRKKSVKYSIPTEVEELSALRANQEAEEYRNELVREEAEISWGDEITRFSQEISKFGATWSDLVNKAPKHDDTTNKVLRVFQAILKANLSQRFCKENPCSKTLEKELNVGVPRRWLNDHRKHLVALLILHEKRTQFPLLAKRFQLPDKGGY